MEKINPDMPHPDSQNLTKEKIRSFLPKGSSHLVTDKILEMINNMEDETGLLQEYMEESFMSHLPVLKGLKVKLEDYVSAIKYCNLKQHMTNDKAWAITFPKRYDKLIAENRFSSSHASMYNKTELVSRIDAQMHVAASIQYAPYFHAAIKKQFDLMNGKGAAEDDYVSPNVQHLAASKLADLTAPAVENTLNVNVQQSETQFEYNRQMNQNIMSLIELQKQAFKRGVSVEELQKIHLTQHSGKGADDEYDDAELVDEEDYDDLEGSMFMKDN